MIGLFALAGRSIEHPTVIANRIADAMQSCDDWTRDVLSVAGCVLGRVGPRTSGDIWQSEDKRYHAVLDGVARHGDIDGAGAAERVNAATLAMALLTEGGAGLLRFQGAFFLLVYDAVARKLYAASDRFGLRTTYWLRQGQQQVFCSEPYPLITMGIIPAELDEQALAFLLRFNKCRLANRTLFRDMRVFPAGTIMFFDTDHARGPLVERYFERDRRSDPCSRQEWVEQLLPVMRCAVEQSMSSAGPACVLALSGGLDSRILLAAMSQSSRQALRTMSFGLPDSREVEIARTVADVAGCRHDNVDLDAADFLLAAHDGVVRNEEFDIFVQGASARLHEAAAECGTALMTGWDVDVTLRGTYLNDAILNMRSRADVQRTINAEWALFSHEELQAVLRPDFAERVLALTEEHLVHLVAALPGSDATQVYLNFVREYEKRRLLMLRNRMIRHRLESVTPLYNARLQHLLAGIPEEAKRDNALFVDLLSALDSSLAQITYQRTMVPANAPVDQWKAGIEEEAGKEAQCRKSLFSSAGKKRYDRYYSNFDEWTICDAGWLQAQEDLFFSSDSRLCEEIFCRKAVRKLVDEHRTGRRNNWSKIIYLMSIEMYLREYF